MGQLRGLLHQLLGACELGGTAVRLFRGLGKCESRWLTTTGGSTSFRQECKEAGKKVMAWTVNDPAEMIEVRMGARR